MGASPPGMTEPTSCSVSTDSFSSESIRITPWLRSCMDRTPRPGGVLPSSTGLGGEGGGSSRSDHSAAEGQHPVITHEFQVITHEIQVIAVESTDGRRV